MCLFPKLIPNKRYLPNKKNNYNPPVPKDRRLLYVSSACGKCSECLSKKAKHWSLRLFYEYYHNNNPCYFVTLTFNNDSLNNLKIKYNLSDNNEIASKAIRLFLERYRKHNKTYFKHFFISELGEINNRLHLHGIIFNFNDISKLDFYWKFGYTYVGNYVNEKSINYILTYIFKSKGLFLPKIFASKGLGLSLLNDPIFKLYTKFNDIKTNDFYQLPSGKRVSIPIYLRNKLYSEDEKEQLWLNKLDKKTIYLKGIKIDISSENGINDYFKLLDYYSKKDKSLGFIGDIPSKHIKLLRKLNLDK